METDLARIGDSNRLKSAETNVQRDAGEFNAVSSECCENLRSEVQSGRRCGGRSRLPRVDGLIAFAILWRIGLVLVAMNVRRQRHVADAFDDGNEVGRGREAESALAEFSGGKDNGTEKWRTAGCG